MRKTFLIRKRFLFALTSIAITVIAMVNMMSDKNQYMDTVNASQLAEASWEYGATTLEELTDYSDIIIKGKLSDYYTEETSGLIFTYETIEAKKVLKGEINEGDMVLVAFTGGELDGKVTSAIKECPIMDFRGDYMLFLKELDFNPGMYVIVAGNQGYGMIHGDTIDLTGSDQLALSMKELKLSDIENEVEKRNGKNKE